MPSSSSRAGMCPTASLSSVPAYTSQLFGTRRADMPHTPTRSPPASPQYQPAPASCSERGGPTCHSRHYTSPPGSPARRSLPYVKPQLTRRDVGPASPSPVPARSGGRFGTGGSRHAKPRQPPSPQPCPWVLIGWGPATPTPLHLGGARRPATSRGSTSILPSQPLGRHHPLMGSCCNSYAACTNVIRITIFNINYDTAATSF